MGVRIQQVAANTTNTSTSLQRLKEYDKCHKKYFNMYPIFPYQMDFTNHLMSKLATRQCCY